MARSADEQSEGLSTCFTTLHKLRSTHENAITWCT